MDSGQSARKGEEIERAASRAVRDNLALLQRTSEELYHAVGDLIAACSSRRPANVLPPMLRAQSSAAALGAALDVLSKFLASTLTLAAESEPEVSAVTSVVLEPLATPAIPPLRFPAPMAMSETVLETPEAPAAEPAAETAPEPASELAAAPAPAEFAEPPAVHEPEPQPEPAPVPDLAAAFPPVAVPEPPVFEPPAPPQAPAFEGVSEPAPEPVMEQGGAPEAPAVEPGHAPPLFNEPVHIPEAIGGVELSEARLPELTAEAQAELAKIFATTPIPTVPETPPFTLENLPAEMQELHRRANRVAKVSMQDIQLMRPGEVHLGREHKDLCKRLRNDLDKARKEYERRFQSILDQPVDYFHHWMVEILGNGDPETLGEYPYPSPVVHR